MTAQNAFYTVHEKIVMKNGFAIRFSIQRNALALTNNIPPFSNVNPFNVFPRMR